MKKHGYILTLIVVFFTLSNSSVFGATETFAPGAYIIDMGVLPQTIANGLKPYGLIYDLVRNNLVPVKWAINPTKSKDGIDFTADGKDYRGGPFIIPAGFAAEAIATINKWRAKGVVVDGPISSGFTAPIYDTITSFPNAVLDQQNAGLVIPYYTNAEIPSTAYKVGLPSALGPCDDVFILPHADPTWANHSTLLSFNQAGGFIWAACHAVSDLELIDDPGDPDTDPDMNFLTVNGTVNYRTPGHANGTLPYSYRDPTNPIMQFLGILDCATQNGSEQIYLPKTGGWRATTTVAVWDPDHPDIPGLSPGQAAVVAYGRGFGNPDYGLVMYESGHTHNKGTVCDVAAQRAYFNFLSLAGSEFRPVFSTLNVPTEMTCCGPAIPVSGSALGGTPPYTYLWTSSCGGTFADSTVASTTFTPPEVTHDTQCVVRLIVRDACGRFNFAASVVTIKVPSVAIAKTVTPSRLNPGGTAAYTVIVTNTGLVTAYLTKIQDILPAGFSYVPGTSSGLTTNDPSIAGQTLTWTGSWTVASGADTSMAYQATAGNEAGIYPSTTSVDGCCIDPPISVTDAAAVEVTIADLSLSKSSDKKLAAIGENVTFTLTLTNGGPSSATGVQVTDLLPAGFTYQSDVPSQGTYTSSTGIWDAGTLNSGGTATLQLVARVDTDEERTNTGEVTASNEFDPDSTPNNSNPNEDDQVRARINARADLVIDKSDSPDPVDAGSALTYTLTVTNNGPSDAWAVVVTDTLPAGAIFQSASGTGWSCSEAAGIVTCTRNTLVNATSSALTITVTAPSAGGTITNVAAVSSVTPDDFLPNNVSIKTVVNPIADLSITKSDSPDPISVNKQLTYTLTVANAGPSYASNVAVTDTLPSGVTFVSAAGAGWNCSKAAGIVTCTRAMLDAGASSTITITVTSPAAEGSITNAATVSATEDDPDTGNNTVTEATTVTAYADLAVTKHSSPDPIRVLKNSNSNLIYTIVVRNNGPVDATGVAVTDTLPPANLGADNGDPAKSVILSYVSSVPSQGTCSYNSATRVVSCTLGNIAVGKYATITITVKLAALDRAPAITPSNTASAKGDQADPDTGNNTAKKTTTVTVTDRIADLSVTKTDHSNTVNVGQNITYTITVTNNGPEDADPVVLTDVLPSSVTFVSVNASQGDPPVYSNGTVTVNLKRVPKGGGIATVTITVTARETGTIANTASVSSNRVDSDPSNNVAVESTTIIGTTGTVAFVAGLNGAGDVTTITAGDTVFVKVTDGDQNRDPLSSQTVRVTLTSSGGDLETITLTETGNDTGVFTGYILSAIGFPAINGVLQVVRGSISATYTDVLDAEGNTYQPRTDLATVLAPELRLVKSVDKAVAPPNDVLTYTIVYQNVGDTNGYTIVLIDAVPTFTTYVPGSTTGGNTREYSHNGGASFDASDALPVTHVRWVINGPLAPTATGSVGFGVTIN